MIVTRFAPSPTGSLHIGGLRSAVYPFALAKHAGGKFILRIEDTDKKREVLGSREEIEELLQLFGITWDEQYIQSDRVGSGIYQKAAEQLVSAGHAFYCSCEAKSGKHKSFSKKLRDPCRDKNLTEGAIKLKVPDGQTVSFHDFVLNKDVAWDTSTVADATLLKSDGFPTYHLAVVVDDSDMQVSHVLRGHDWMPSTPIHLLVYQFLKLPVPAIGHLTDILDPEGGKLSKRKGSVSVKGMLGEGYLPEALLNFVILLGWAPKDNRELFTLEEFVKAFDITGFQKANPVLNRDKLDWFNGYYIRQKSDTEVAELIKPYFEGKVDENLLVPIAALIKDRIKKLTDVQAFAGFFFQEPKVDTKLFGKDYKEHLEKAVEVLAKLDKWDLDNLNTALMRLVEAKGFQTGDFFMSLRIAITGSKFTPPITDSIVLLGKEKTVKRLKELI